MHSLSPWSEDYKNYEAGKKLITSISVTEIVWTVDMAPVDRFDQQLHRQEAKELAKPNIKQKIISIRSWVPVT